MPMPVVWCDGFDSTDSTHESTWYTAADFNVGTPGRLGVGQYATVGTSAFKTIPGGPYTYMGAARAVRWNRSCSSSVAPFSIAACCATRPASSS